MLRNYEKRKIIKNEEKNRIKFVLKQIKFTFRESATGINSQASFGERKVCACVYACIWYSYTFCACQKFWSPKISYIEIQNSFKALPFHTINSNANWILSLLFFFCFFFFFLLWSRITSRFIYEMPFSSHTENKLCQSAELKFKLRN